LKKKKYDENLAFRNRREISQKSRDSVPLRAERTCIGLKDPIIADISGENYFGIVARAGRKRKV
jgi:hypothetical protein